MTPTDLNTLLEGCAYRDATHLIRRGYDLASSIRASDDKPVTRTAWVRAYEKRRPTTGNRAADLLDAAHARLAEAAALADGDAWMADVYDERAAELEQRARGQLS